MSGESLQVFLAAFAVWGVAIVIKAANAIRTGEPYTFGYWDGGILRNGKYLSKVGVRVKLIVALVLGGGCALLLAGVVPLHPTIYVVMGAAIVGLVADLALCESPHF